MTEYNSKLKLSKDFLLGGILAATSIAIGNSKRAYFSKDKIATAVLYLTIVGRPGANKTKPLEIAFNPIRRKEHDFDDEQQFTIKIDMPKLSINYSVLNIQKKKILNTPFFQMQPKRKF